MIVRKTPVAAFLALLLTFIIPTVFVPSIVNGGLHYWQTLGAPLILLLATRMAYWSWAAGNLNWGSPLFTLIGNCLLALGWIGGSLWYRTIEVPDAPDYVDGHQFEKDLTPPGKNRARFLIEKVVKEFEERDRTASVGKLSWVANPSLIAERTRVLGSFVLGHGQSAGQSSIAFPAVSPYLNAFVLSGLNLDGPPQNSGLEADSAKQAIQEGWSEQNVLLGRNLDYIFAGNWAKDISDLPNLPVGMLRDPQDTFKYRDDSIERKSETIIPLMLARALQLQSRGKSEEALQLLGIAFSWTSNLRPGGYSHSSLVSHTLDGKNLATLQRWLEAAAPDPRLLRAAIRMVNEHEISISSFSSTALKVNYVAACNQIFLSTSGADVWALEAIPWEKDRQHRILNNLFEGVARSIRLGYPDYMARIRELQIRDATVWDTYWLSMIEWLPPDVDLGLGHKEMVGFETLYRDSPVLIRAMQPFSFAQFLPTHLQEAHLLGHLRAEKLLLALALYRIEKGAPAPNLDALVPRYLPSVPVDPFCDRPFNYRLSNNDTIFGIKSATRPFSKQTAEPERPQIPFLGGFGGAIGGVDGLGGVGVDRSNAVKVPKGREIVWSVGPDMKNNGGKYQGRDFSRLYEWTKNGYDWIFLVPHWD